MTHLNPATAERLMNAAREAAENAYVPYSNFPVGAAVLTSGGEVITGCNVENASYPLSVCAERVAINSAVAAGHRHLSAIAITAPNVPSVTPCGGCRQVISEFRMPGQPLWVVLEGETSPEILEIDDLLPRSFQSSDLG